MNKTPSFFGLIPLTPTMLVIYRDLAARPRKSAPVERLLNLAVIAAMRQRP